MSADVVLFDLGGVLANFGGVGPLRELAGIESDEELWRRWLTFEPVRLYESGVGTAEEFVTKLVAEWQLPITVEELLAVFPGWPVGAYDGAVELVREVAAAARVACLTNTNQLQWEAGMATWPLIAEFERAYLSFEIGAVKPDIKAFEHVIGDLGAPATNVLFLDDNQLNVDGALEAGLQARRVRGVDGARQALVESGVLTAESAASGS